MSVNIWDSSDFLRNKIWIDYDFPVLLGRLPYGEHANRRTPNEKLLIRHCNKASHTRPATVAFLPDNLLRCLDDLVGSRYWKFLGGTPRIS